jgi:thioredoxin-related protein
MKAIIFSSLILIFTGGDWLVDFEAAQQQAKEGNKLILLNFSGSDWCAPCIKLKKDVFEQEPFKAYAQDNLILVRADFPRLKKNQLTVAQVKHNEKLAEKYNPQGKFPYTLLLKADGTVIREWDGYPGVSPDEFVNQVKGHQSN